MKRNLKICDINAGSLISGYDFPVYGVSDPENPCPNTIIFAKHGLISDKHLKNSIIITEKHLETDSSCVQIVTDKPKNEYAAILNRLESLLEKPKKIYQNGSYISEDALVGKNAKIGLFCVIEDDVIIGNDCVIADYTYVGSHTRIGSEVQIQQRCTIGSLDADIFRTGDRCLTVPHLGGISIEDGCLLLEGAAIAAGDTQATVMRSGSMLGIGASLGHNSYVGKKTLIGAHACVCGHCYIGDDVYIAPSAVVMNRVEVGSRANIGLGSVVLQNVATDTRVFGNPALSWRNASEENQKGRLRQ